MSIPGWLLEIFAGVALLVALLSAGYLMAVRAWDRAAGAGADVALSQVLMGIALAGVLVTGLSTLPNAVWAVVFAAMTAWFDWRLWQQSRERSSRMPSSVPWPPIDSTRPLARRMRGSGWPAQATVTLTASSTSIRAQAAAEIAPLAAEIDREQRFSPRLWEITRAMNLTGLAFSEEIGGQGGSYLAYVTAIEEVDTGGGVVITQTGVPLQKLQERVGDDGFMFPLDLGARGSCTIGGNISTNAGGNRVIRYGMTRDLVLGLEAVLADGTILKGVRKYIKNNTGIDLKQLFVGTEGTLGVVTRAALRIFPAPAEQPAPDCSRFAALEATHKAEVDGQIALIDAAANAGDSAALTKAMLHDAGVVVVPGEAFGTHEHIRFSYAVSHKDVEEGLTRLRAFVAKF